MDKLPYFIDNVFFEATNMAYVTEGIEKLGKKISSLSDLIALFLSSFVAWIQMLIAGRLVDTVTSAQNKNKLETE